MVSLQLGPSSLAGFGLFIVITPIQILFMKQQFKLRKGSMRFTDKRAKTMLEVLGMFNSLTLRKEPLRLNTPQGAMRVVKYFSYENSFLSSAFHHSCSYTSLIYCADIYESRRDELSGIVRILISQSAKWVSFRL